MPFFSVIIPTYNRAVLLAEALDSVFAQEFTDYEVLVVDDGSTDETMGILSSYGNRIRIFRQDNRGPGAARNLGIQNAVGEYVAFLDSDDLWFPWTLTTYADAIHLHRHPSIVLGHWWQFKTNDASLQLVHQTLIRERFFSDFLSAGSTAIFFGTNYAVVRRAIFAQGLLFTEAVRVLEDQDLGLRMGIEPGCLIIESPVTVAYRDTVGSLTTNSQRYLEGVIFLIKSEKSGRYPGGRKRRRERYRYVCYTTRSFSLGLLRKGSFSGAFRIYWQTLVWHLKLFRFRYILGFPAMAFIMLIKRFFTNRSEAFP